MSSRSNKVSMGETWANPRRQNINAQCSGVRCRYDSSKARSAEMEWISSERNQSFRIEGEIDD
eukprot:746735-Hanusia_phi.AAC.3